LAAVDAGIGQVLADVTVRARGRSFEGGLVSWSVDSLLRRSSWPAKTLNVMTLPPSVSTSIVMPCHL
jgi:hypothetical protein